jgi:short subunit dehydrogenase-like uncharacterized protein
MPFLLYGAYGYTGELIAEEAVRRGMQPILAGRNPEKLRALADRLDLDYAVADLNDRAALDAALAKVPVVLHAAGPFRYTSRPMAEACLRTGTHYLDITGEVEVFEMLAGMDDAAREAGIMLLPGVGFDVVPTDCLARYLKEELPSATHLEIAFMGLSGVSRGTATTAIEQMGEGGLIRRDGVLRTVPAAWRTREIDFGPKVRDVVSIPWGDLATAYRTTGIPNITTYAALGHTEQRLLLLSRYFGWLLGSTPVQALLKWLIQLQPPGPTEQQRREGRSFVWGRVRDDDGNEAVTRLTTPEGYRLTVLAALAITQKVLDGAAEPGFQTPAGRFGADLVLELDDTAREDVTD